MHPLHKFIYKGQEQTPRISPFVRSLNINKGWKPRYMNVYKLDKYKSEVNFLNNFSEDTRGA